MSDYPRHFKKVEIAFVYLIVSFLIVPKIMNGCAITIKKRLSFRKAE